MSSRVSLVLASQSPARQRVLTGAGVQPYVVVSGVDEEEALDAATASAGALEPPEVALVLARAKCEAVADRLQSDDDDPLPDVDEPLVVLGCDSVLELDGQIHGKPATPAEAVERWRSMRGRSGTLHSGHWLIDLRDDEDGGQGGTLGATSSTVVHFGDVTDEEIEVYVHTGEPMEVAGAFTLDGLAGPFVSGIEGDHHTVLGLGLPLLRELLGQLGIAWFDVVELD